MISYFICVDGMRVEESQSERILFGTELSDKVKQFSNKHGISSKGVTLEYVDNRFYKDN